MRILRVIKNWLKRERELRRARQQIDAVFRNRDLIGGTSLRADHRSRTQILEVLEGGDLIRFGIIRHPKPHAFSNQYHEVFELWEYRVPIQELARVRGVNLSKLGGDSDGRAPDHGAPF